MSTSSDRADAPAATPAASLLSRLPATLIPDRNLLVYYFLTSLLLGPAFFVILLPQYFRYRTLRYDVDEEGIRMRWGVLFRREVSLTYARIQDIHLASNVVERWLDLGRIQIQTASGSAAAELTIEGVRDIGRLRDFLYERMRGARDRRSPTATSEDGEFALQHHSEDELTAALNATAAEMRAIREFLERRLPAGGEQ